MRALAFLASLGLLIACPTDDEPAADGDGTTTAAAGTRSDSSGGTAEPGTTAGGNESDSGSGPATSSTGSADSSSGAAESTGAPVCVDELPAIVVDIDATLTISNGELNMQLQDGNYDPIERVGGPAMVNQYADLGYRVLYLTSRSETLVAMVTNEPGREMTFRWLDEHGFPLDEDTTRLMLAPMFVSGAAAQMYKAGALMDLQAEGWRFDYAYGDAATDIGAFGDAGIAKDTTFIIGPLAGSEGTVAINNEDWLAHSQTHLPTVPAACDAK